MPEQNQVKNSYPLKIVTKHQNLCIFTHMYPLLLWLGIKPDEVTKKTLKRRILTNRPHSVSPQQALEVFQTDTLGGISCFFITLLLEVHSFISQMLTISWINSFWVSGCMTRTFTSLIWLFRPHFPRLDKKSSWSSKAHTRILNLFHITL